MDEIYDKIFDAIEPALQAAGFQVSEGDHDTVYLDDPESGRSIELKLKPCT